MKDRRASMDSIIIYLAHQLNFVYYVSIWMDGRGSAPDLPIQSEG
jgi:hypothetical protein